LIFGATGAYIGTAHAMSIDIPASIISQSAAPSRASNSSANSSSYEASANMSIIIAFLGFIIEHFSTSGAAAFLENIAEKLLDKELNGAAASLDFIFIFIIFS
jgi:hypothetical protein